MRTITLDAGQVAPGYPSVSPTPGNSRLFNGARKLRLSGDVFHLYLLLGAELLITGALRGWSRNHHGG